MAVMGIAGTEGTVVEGIAAVATVVVATAAVAIDRANIGAFVKSARSHVRERWRYFPSPLSSGLRAK